MGELAQLDELVMRGEPQFEPWRPQPQLEER
jgi:hypothetical protein